MLSGFISFCLSRHELSSYERTMILCTNCFVGLMQLATVVFLFIGWFWSVTWGCAFVGLSCKLGISDQLFILTTNLQINPFTLTDWYSMMIGVRPDKTLVWNCVVVMNRSLEVVHYLVTHNAPVIVLTCQESNRQTDWLNVCLSDWLTDWRTDRLKDRQTDR